MLRLCVYKSGLVAEGDGRFGWGVVERMVDIWSCGFIFLDHVKYNNIFIVQIICLFKKLRGLEHISTPPLNDIFPAILSPPMRILRQGLVHIFLVSRGSCFHFTLSSLPLNFFSILNSRLPVALMCVLAGFFFLGEDTLYCSFLFLHSNPIV